MTTHAELAVEEYAGDRDALRWLLALAEDSEGQLRSYLYRVGCSSRDAFTAATGYPPGSLVEGIPLRDRVWLDVELSP